MYKHLETLKNLQFLNEFKEEYALQNIVSLDRYVEESEKGNWDYARFIAHAFSWVKSKRGCRFWEMVADKVPLPDDLTITDKKNHLSVECFPDGRVFITIAHKEHDDDVTNDCYEVKVNTEQISALIKKLIEIKFFLC